jgi:uncharacterized membrane protein
VALFLFGLGCDAALLVRLRVGWLDRTALLSFAAAALASLATALSGKLSFDSLAGSLGEGEAAAAGLHGDWAFATVVLFFIVLAVRFDAFWRDRALVAPRATGARVVALLLSIVAAYCLVETASRGGELVLRYGVGVERGR